MKKSAMGFLSTLAMLLALGVTACTAARAAYTDPFAYCAAVGTIDKPDSRYTGVPVPAAIIQGYLKAAGLENNGEPLDILQKSTIWRCINESVYVCNFGANLPCDSKADTDKNPTQPMQDFCKANPTADYIPMSVTGHATIYSWGCVNNTPKLLGQIEQVDASGYIAQIWYKLPPNP